MKKFAIAFTILLTMKTMVFGCFLMAQDQGGQSVEMAETFRSEGKIYVVVLVVAIVFTGLILFAANTERKLRKIEKEVESLKSTQDS